MSPPVVLLIAVAASPAVIELTQAAAEVCRVTLPNSRAIVRTVATLPSDLDLAADAAATGANALVVLVWQDSEFLTHRCSCDGQTVGDIGRRLGGEDSRVQLSRSYSRAWANHWSRDRVDA